MRLRVRGVQKGQSSHYLQVHDGACLHTERGPIAGVSWLLKPRRPRNYVPPTTKST